MKTNPINEAINLLDDIYVYMDRFADAGPEPNEEMTFSVRINEVIEALDEIRPLTKKDIAKTDCVPISDGQYAVRAIDLDGRIVREFVGNNGNSYDTEADDRGYVLYEKWYESLPN